MDYVLNSLSLLPIFPFLAKGQLATADSLEQFESRSAETAGSSSKTLPSMERKSK
jgi:hypothetical protein